MAADSATAGRNADPGAAGGVFFARWGVAYLLHAIPARSLPYLPNFGRVDVDWKVLLSALGIALGARRGDVLRLIVGQGMGLVLGGMLVGIAGAVGMAKLLATFLYGITPTDPATFVTTFVVLAAVAVVACAIPARRASKIDPIVALRYE